MRTPRLAVVRDFRAEGWPSMDLCADQLVAHLPQFAPTDFAPPFRRRGQHIPLLGRSHSAFNADRLLNRHVYLPRALRRAASRFDLFHIADHTYAHTVLALPPGRAGVYCHDLDAFRCLLDPAAEPRPWWFRRLASGTLRGLRAATVVFHNSAEVGRQLVATGLVAPDRLVHAPLGVADEFVPADGARGAEPYLLHVGNNIPRKRLDVLLDVFAAVREQSPGLRLVQVGGPWPPALADRVDCLGIGPWVTQVRGLTRPRLADLYRQAAAVLVPSEAEGFGLPVIEALACGAPVVASDLPVLREVGGPAVAFAPVGDVAAWAATVGRILTDPPSPPTRDARLAQAARYSWAEHARVIGETYQSLWARA